MAIGKGGLDSIKAAVAGMASKLPFSRRADTAPEPFSAIEDDTPISDLLSSANAAPGMAEKKPGSGKAELRGIAVSIFRSAVKSPPMLFATIVAALFVLALIVTAIVVALPPKAAPAEAPFTQKGRALVRTWLPPPGDPFEGTMEMQRAGSKKYTTQDAAKLGIDPDPRIVAGLHDKNDEAIEDLYRTVP